jgi:hypothetical protein
MKATIASTISPCRAQFTEELPQRERQGLNDGVVSAARVRARGMTRLFFTCRGGDPDRARQRPARAMQCVVWGDPARRSGPDIIVRDKRGDHNEPTQRLRHDCNDWHRTCLVSGARFRPGGRLRTGDERTQHLHERRRGTRAPGRSRGARQAPFARHPGVNDLWIGIAAWPRSAALHPRARRRARPRSRARRSQRRATDAALANGVMAHADETDDSHNARSPAWWTTATSPTFACST